MSERTQRRDREKKRKAAQNRMCKVGRLLQHRQLHRKMQYNVRWEDFAEKYDSWVDADGVSSAAIEAYTRRAGDLPTRQADTDAGKALKEWMALAPGGSKRVTEYAPASIALAVLRAGASQLRAAAGRGKQAAGGKVNQLTGKNKQAKSGDTAAVAPAQVFTGASAQQAAQVLTNY